MTGYAGLVARKHKALQVHAMKGMTWCKGFSAIIDFINAQVDLLLKH